jgi:hypothetical protein
MKPVLIFERSCSESDRLVRRFPFTDYNYRASSYFDFQGGHCTNLPAPSFRNISRSYFRQEARYNFIIEAFLFVGVVLTSGAALVISAVALIDFLRTLGYV